jgi:hypothetical protein
MNNPLKYSDPTGNMADEGDDGGICDEKCLEKLNKKDDDKEDCPGRYHCKSKNSVITNGKLRDIYENADTLEESSRSAGTKTSGIVGAILVVPALGLGCTTPATCGIAFAVSAVGIPAIAGVSGDIGGNIAANYYKEIGHELGTIQNSESNYQVRITTRTYHEGILPGGVGVDHTDYVLRVGEADPITLYGPIGKKVLTNLFGAVP